MEKSRMTNRAELAKLKLATRLQYHSSEVSRQDMLRHTRVESSDLTKYGDDNEPKRFMPVDVLVDITRITQNPSLLNHVAELCDYDLVARYEDASPGVANDETMLRVMSEFNDLVREYMARKGDGLDLQDRTVLRREGHQAVAAILTFMKGI